MTLEQRIEEKVDEFGELWLQGFDTRYVNRAKGKFKQALTSIAAEAREEVENSEVENVLKDIFKHRTYGAYGVDHILTKDLLAVAETYGVALNLK